MLEYQNIKTFSQTAMFQIGLKKFLFLQKLKVLLRRHFLFLILQAKNLLGCFTKKKFKKQIKKSLKLKKKQKILSIICWMERLWQTLLTVGMIKRHSINERIFSRTKIFWKKNGSWTRLGRFEKCNMCWYIKICWKNWFS